MNHYFINDETLGHNYKDIEYYFNEHKFTFTTDLGIFSKDHVDEATNILIHSLPRNYSENTTLLDMGCGYGVIGIVLSKAFSLDVTQCDINEKAIDLTRGNAKKNNVKTKVILSNCFDNITERFDIITINPPIHAGKSVTYKMYEDSYGHLNKRGKLYIVTFKKHGAESTQKKLYEIYNSCDTIYKKKGIYVFSCTKN